MINRIDRSINYTANKKLEIFTPADILIRNFGADFENLFRTSLIKKKIVAITAELCVFGHINVLT